MEDQRIQVASRNTDGTARRLAQEVAKMTAKMENSDSEVLFLKRSEAAMVEAERRTRIENDELQAEMTDLPASQISTNAKCKAKVHVSVAKERPLPLPPSSFKTFLKFI